MLATATCIEIPTALAITWNSPYVGITTTSAHSYQINRDMAIASTIRLTMSTHFDLTGLALAAADDAKYSIQYVSTRLRNLSDTNDRRRMLTSHSDEEDTSIVQAGHERLLGNSYLVTLTLKAAVSAGTAMTLTLEHKNPLVETLPAASIDANFYNEVSS